MKPMTIQNSLGSITLVALAGLSLMLSGCGEKNQIIDKVVDTSVQTGNQTQTPGKEGNGAVALYGLMLDRGNFAVIWEVHPDYAFNTQFELQMCEVNNSNNCTTGFFVNCSANNDCKVTSTQTHNMIVDPLYDALDEDGNNLKGFLVREPGTVLSNQGTIRVRTSHNGVEGGWRYPENIIN